MLPSSTIIPWTAHMNKLPVEFAVIRHTLTTKKPCNNTSDTAQSSIVYIVISLRSSNRFQLLSAMHTGLVLDWQQQRVIRHDGFKRASKPTSIHCHRRHRFNMRHAAYWLDSKQDNASAIKQFAIKSTLATRLLLYTWWCRCEWCTQMPCSDWCCLSLDKNTHGGSLVSTTSVVHTSRDVLPYLLLISSCNAASKSCPCLMFVIPPRYQLATTSICSISLITILTILTMTITALLASRNIPTACNLGQTSTSKTAHSRTWHLWPCVQMQHASTTKVKHMTRHHQ